MASKRKGRKRRKKPKSGEARHVPDRCVDVSETDFQQVEYHRQAMALLPEPGDKRSGIAYLFKQDSRGPETRFCTCAESNKKTCRHILKIARIYWRFSEDLGSSSAEDALRGSIWHRLGTILAEGCKERPNTVSMQLVYAEGARGIRVLDSGGNEMLTYYSAGRDLDRFLERFGQGPEGSEVSQRCALLDNLLLVTLSDNERLLADRGFKSRRQAFEESFWYRLGYHAYREFGEEHLTFRPAIEEATGAFTIGCRAPATETHLRLVIPRKQVRAVLDALRQCYPNDPGLALHPIPLKSLFKVSANTELDLELRPMIQLLQEEGEAHFFAREELERFRYGDLVYIKEIGILAELEPPGPMARKFKEPVKMVLQRSQVPSFMQEFGQELKHGKHLVDNSLKNLKVFDQYDRLQITPDALERDWCWLSMRYGFGSSSVSLLEILRAREEGRQYIPTADGWVNCLSPEFDVLSLMGEKLGPAAPDGDADRLKLSPLEVLRIKASATAEVEVKGEGAQAPLLERLLELRPAQPLAPLQGLASTLRAYQRIGVEWLRFLYENGFGGLLCDDMGLGKTHQVMALMLALREMAAEEAPFLVVAPTTVLSHWRDKISQHAPGLQATVFHGGERNLEQALEEGDVVITSYGILRNDIDQLKTAPFALVAFDEIQNIKNAQTLTYRAAEELPVPVKIGLTGTPLENRLDDLKALFDLTNPGYLGRDEDFQRTYVKPIENGADPDRRRELSRVISPFTLRRLKTTVLSELPEKIEDIRSCTLGEDQVRLYREAISSRGVGLRDILRQGKEPVPYMHIFALLTLLKQICDHPALVEGRPEDYERYHSGKWELFTDLIAESLDSGQKVVVYSQFLDMIRIIGKYLERLGVGFATLTGSSRNRSEIISRFNNDPDCRVYVGSLKAGGAGIDLIAGSVVVHYDRWWNAAKEDQATDRVHRIGQRRGVQVFKLVTEGTLEEKISAIIDKKRSLMESVVREDDPGLLKTFTREQLLDMLSLPTQTGA